MTNLPEPPKKPRRNRASAKKAGALFERHIADYLRDNWSDYIDRKVKTGAKDTGDIANFRTPTGERITVECKNTSRLALPQWWREAQEEQANAGDGHTIVVHKRQGVGDPGAQWVTMTLDQLLALIGKEE